MEVVVTRQVMVLISTLIPSLKLAASLTVTALLTRERHGIPRAQQIYGGSDVYNLDHDSLDEPAHGQPASLLLTLPPLATLMLVADAGDTP